MEPPRPDSLPGYDSIPPPIKEQLEQLADGLGDVTRAIGRVWDARNDTDRLNKLETKIDAYTQTSARTEAVLNEWIVPWTKEQAAALDKLVLAVERLSPIAAAVGELEKRFASFGDRLTKIEAAHELATERWAREAGAIDAKAGSAAAVGNSLDVRVTALERRNADGDAGDKRQRKLIGAALAVISLLGGVAGWVASKLFK